VRRDRGEGGGVLEVLVLAGGLVPLAAMLVALFTAAWLREGRPEQAALVRKTR
jgi:hypothetical protein